jgi:cytochrome b
MSAFARLRIYHLTIGALAVAAYVSQEVELLHPWIGYALAGLLSLRLLTVLTGIKLLPPAAWIVRRADHQPKLGLANPIISKSFIAGIMVALALTLTSGIMLDQSRSNATSTSIMISTAHADDHGKSKRPKGSKIIKEVHEFSANLMLSLVALHIAYLLLMRRNYALRMIYIK